MLAPWYARAFHWLTDRQHYDAPLDAPLRDPPSTVRDGHPSSPILHLVDRGGMPYDPED
jgi:hypothetical protein